MVIFLDVSLLKPFDIIFPAVLVFALVFALLQKTKAITESNWINAVVAAVVSFLLLLSESAVQIIKFIIPWFVVLIIFIVLLLLIFQIFGATEKNFINALTKDSAIRWTILGVAIVIIFAAFGSVLGQSVGPYLSEQGGNATVAGGTSVATGSFSQNITATLFHPKVLGLMILFGIMIFAIILLTGSEK